MTVGKTYVAELLRTHHYEIELLRQKYKHHQPRSVPHNLIWALDLTGKTDRSGHTHAVLGILEHRSRSCLALRALTDKSSLTILRCLLEVIEQFGPPKCVRTDNEAVLTSRLFRFCLFVLGIRHQRTEPGHPWQNGRIERFFLTLKQKLDCWEVDSASQLNADLPLFRFWYNHVRPHDHLQGWTPAEVWQGVDPFRTCFTQHRYFSAWQGLLTGIWLRR